MEVVFLIVGLFVFEAIIQRRRSANPAQTAPRLWNLARFGITQPAPMASEAAPHLASNLFAQAVRDNSNLELDWLWLATQVTRDAERRYCLERALVINPHSAAAREALATLPRSAAPTADVPAFAPSGDA
jgi:hypothetical protein